VRHFEPSKFYAYKGPNCYLRRQALVFNLRITPEGESMEPLLNGVGAVFPDLDAGGCETSAELFAAAVMETLRMDIDLYLKEHSIGRDGEDYVIAVEYLDDGVAEEVVHSVCDWFDALASGEAADFAPEFERLQAEFDKTFFGGPTFYSIYEAALKRDIPVHYLFEENQFQWGYGKKQVRGRSTTVSTDGIKDTEFTMYKDMVGDFLVMCGFPTPKGATCSTEESLVESSRDLTYPLVVKPVAGHKGEGVTTNIRDEAGIRRAFQNILDKEGEESLDEGILVQEQVEGTDHRLLSVKGKFVAALQRVPAYVDGNGKDTIESLIERENDTVARLDNARSPLCKIKMDDDLKEYLELQDLTVRSVPAEGERVYLRRVANISAGGVSINVTEKIHPINVKLVEDIAAFFNVACLGIDVLADDIAKPWTDGHFGIIEINAGPGVFMHLAPALGGSIDVPGEIMRSHFPKDRYERIPIVAGNCLTTSFCKALHERLASIKPGIATGCLTPDGVHFNGAPFFKNEHHDQNVKIILRHQGLEFAAFNHTKEDLWDYGMFHQGADVVILEDPGDAEQALKRDLLPDGALIEVRPDAVVCKVGGEETSHRLEGDREGAVMAALEPLLGGLIDKYD